MPNNFSEKIYKDPRRRESTQLSLSIKKDTKRRMIAYVERCRKRVNWSRKVDCYLDKFLESKGL